MFWAIGTHRKRPEDPARHGPCDLGLRRAFLRIVRRHPLAAPMAWPGTDAKSITQPIVLGRFEDGGQCASHSSVNMYSSAMRRDAGRTGVLNVARAWVFSRPHVHEGPAGSQATPCALGGKGRRVTP